MEFEIMFRERKYHFEFLEATEFVIEMEFGSSERLLSFVDCDSSRKSMINESARWHFVTSKVFSVFTSILIAGRRLTAKFNSLKINKIFMAEFVLISKLSRELWKNTSNLVNGRRKTKKFSLQVWVIGRENESIAKCFRAVYCWINFKKK